MTNNVDQSKTRQKSYAVVRALIRRAGDFSGDQKTKTRQDRP